MSEFSSFPPIVTGLTSQGTNAARPAVFKYNGGTYLYNAGKTNAWKWNSISLAWEVDTLFSTFDVPPANYSGCEAFWIGAELFLITITNTNTKYGYKWSEVNQRWEQHAEIVSGITLLNTYNDPTVFSYEEKTFLITTDRYCNYKGYRWNNLDQTWEDYPAIVSGLQFVNAYYIRPDAFILDNELVINTYGDQSYKWNDQLQTWESINIGSLLNDDFDRTFFEIDGFHYVIYGSSSGAWMGYKLQGTAKIDTLIIEPGENLKAKLVVKLLEALDSKDVLIAYSAPDSASLGNPDYLVELVQKDSITWEAQTDRNESQICYFRVVQKWHETEIDVENKTETYYILPEIAINKLNITNPADYRVLDNPVHALNHGSLFLNGFIYGSARNVPVLGPTDIFKIEAADYSNLTQVTIFRDKINSLNRIAGFEQIVTCKNFIWGHVGLYLIRINPSDLDYMVFSTPIQAGGQPLVADEDYIYLTAGREATKIDVGLLIDSFDFYGYNGQAPVDIPAPAILASCDLIQIHPVYFSYSHASAVDSQYLYVACTTPGDPNKSGYDSDLGIDFCHVQKIRKADMVTIDDVIVPKSTDDIAQNSEYLFLGPETKTLNSKGYYWGLYAINKKTFEIRYLKYLIPQSNFGGGISATYGVYYYNSKVIVLSAAVGRMIVVDISQVEDWGDNFPIGGATEAIFDFQLNGVDFSEVCNEFNLDNAGNAHVNTWEENTMVFKFPVSQITTVDKSPIIQSSLLSTGSDSATLGGYIIDEGKSPITAVGFRYGTDPENLVNDVPVALSYDFETVLNSLDPGVYYFQAYATNTEGTFYGNTVVFSTYNALSLAHDTAAALLEWVNENYGCSILCVQDAPGVADGVTGTAIDQDGNEYNTVVINQKRWFIENLKAKHYRNGEPVPEVTDPGTWAALVDGGQSAYKNDSKSI